MIPQTMSTLEKIKLQEFYKMKIKEAFQIRDTEKKGILDRR